MTNSPNKISIKNLTDKASIKTPLLAEEGCPQGGVVRMSPKKQLNNLPHLKQKRKNLRNNSTPAEATLWNFLKNSQLNNKKFRRQHSIANYILDFYCPSEKLAIELDGSSHDHEIAAAKDRARDLFCASCGVKILRFENKAVFENLDGLVAEVRRNFGWTKKLN